MIIPPARGSHCDKQGVVTGTLKINVSGLQGQGLGQGQSQGQVQGDQEVFEEEERRNKVSLTFCRVLYWTGLPGKVVKMKNMYFDFAS